MIDLSAFRDGDRVCLEAVVREFGPLVLTVARSYARDVDHAEDLFQQIWMRVLEKRGSFSGRGSFEGWLHRVATNICIGDYRIRKLDREGLTKIAKSPAVDDLSWRPDDPLSDTIRLELHGRLHRAMGRLSDREHEAVTLRIVEGRPPEEVANLMGLTKATVRSHIRHAVARLKKVMEGDDDGMSGLESTG